MKRFELAMRRLGILFILLNVLSPLASANTAYAEDTDTSASFPSPSEVDTDGDGLTDFDEVNLHGTDIQLWDTDGDGVSDGDEVLVYRTNPLEQPTPEPQPVVNVDESATKTSAPPVDEDLEDPTDGGDPAENNDETPLPPSGDPQNTDGEENSDVSGSNDTSGDTGSPDEGKTGDDTTAPDMSQRNIVPAGQGQPGNGHTPVNICHATGNPGKYVSQSPDAEAIFSQGHDQHQDGRDIIPPFDYTFNDEPRSYPGKNWDAYGQAVWNNDCNEPDPKVSLPSISISHATCVAGAAGTSSFTITPSANVNVVSVTPAGSTTDNLTYTYDGSSNYSIWVSIHAERGYGWPDDTGAWIDAGNGKLKYKVELRKAECQPEISISKIADQSTVAPGGQVSFQITVNNTGSGAASNVQITDELSNLVTGWTTSTPGCSVSGTTLTCIFQTLTPNLPVTVSVSGMATTDTRNCGEDISNRATVTWDGQTRASGEMTISGSNEGNSKTSEWAKTRIQCSPADINLVKSPTSQTAAPGGQASFTITATNNGGQAANNVVVTDTLQSGFSSWVPVDGCTIDGALISCDLGSIGASGNASVTVTANVADSATCGATLSNTAAVSWGDGIQTPSEVTPLNGGQTSPTGGSSVSNSVTVTVECGNAVKPLISTSPAVCEEGAATTSSFTVSELVGLEITDIDPDPVSTDDLTYAYDGSQDHSITVTFKLLQGFTWPEGWTHEGNTATLTVDLESAGCTPKVDISKVADKSIYTAGETITFTIEVTNTGDGTAYGYGFTDTLQPAGLAWTENSDACEIDGGILTCSFDEIGVNNGTQSVTVSADLPEDSQLCGDFTNTAQLTRLAPRVATQGAPQLPSSSATIAIDCSSDIKITICHANEGQGQQNSPYVPKTIPKAAVVNGHLDHQWGEDIIPEFIYNGMTYGPQGDQSLLRTNCVPTPNVELTKTADKETVAYEGTVSFTITATNSGNGTANNVVITDNAPAGLSFTGITSETGAACTLTGNSMNCPGIELGANTSYTVTVAATPDGSVCGKVTNTASVSWGDLNGTSRTVSPPTNDASATKTVIIQCEEADIPEISITDAVCQSGAPTDSSFTLTLGEGFKIDSVVPAGNVDGTTYSYSGAIDQQIDITIKLLPGYTMPSDTGDWSADGNSLSLTINLSGDPCTTAKLTTPGVTGNVCEDGVYTPPTVTITGGEGVTYSGGEVDPGTGEFTVTATLANGYAWPETLPEGWVKVNATTATWSDTLTLNTCSTAIPVDPTVKAGSCIDGVYTAPTVKAASGPAGITYSVTGPDATGIYSVTATLGSTYVFGTVPDGWTPSEDGRSATFDGTVALNKCIEAIPVEPTIVAGVCTNGEWTAPTVTAGTTTGITYVVTGPDLDTGASR